MEREERAELDWLSFPTDCAGAIDDEQEAK